MSRVPDLRQIKKEDFDKDDQDMIEKIAYPFNNFMQQVIDVLKKGVDFNNLNQFYTTITVSVNTSGVPTTAVKFKNALSTKPAGVTCISFTNSTSQNRFPAGQPGIAYTLTETGMISITNVSGLSIPDGQTVSDTYQLTLQIIGQNLPTA